MSNLALMLMVETKKPARGIEKRSVTIKDLSKLFSNKSE